MIFLIWLLFAIATASIAETKGYSVGGWFVLGLVLGVFALIIIAFMPPRWERPDLSGKSS